jgi:hypothetical protein
MFKKEGVMKTEVDSLMTLLETKGRITIPKAAKHLNISNEVLEEIASFLEEEGKVEVHYGIGDPVIIPSKLKPVVPKPENKEEESEEPIEEMTGPEIETMMARAHSLIKGGHIKEAKEIYDKLQVAYDVLPSSYLTKKNEIEDELVRLNNEISLNLEKEFKNIMKEQSVKINALLKKAEETINKGDLEDSIKIYNEVRSIFSSLPKGFYTEKLGMTEKILSTYKVVAAKRNQELTKQMRQKGGAVELLLDKVTKMIAEGKIDEALSSYEQIRTIYSTMPNGFLEEKILLQEKMLSVYRDLIVNKKSSTMNKVAEGTQKINGLLEQVNHYLGKKDFEGAMKTYKEVREIYIHLPSGFIKYEFTLQNKILDAYKKLVASEKDFALKVIEKGKEKISALVKKANYYKDNKEFDMAFQYYVESVNAYNGLPEGFDENKILLRNQVYNVYYHLVSQTDLVELGELDDYTKEKYFKLLKLLVTSHKIIDANEFELMPEIYQSIYLVYNELPLYLVHKKTKLVKEIHRIYELYRLYENTESLRTFLEKNDMAGLVRALGIINQTYNYALRHSPEDIKLLHFVKDRHDNYYHYARGLISVIPEYVPRKENALDKQLPITKDQRHRSLSRLESQRVSSDEIEKEVDQLESSIYQNLVDTKKDLESKHKQKSSRLLKLDKANALFQEAKNAIDDEDINEAIIKLSELVRLEPNYPKAGDILQELERKKIEDIKDDLKLSLLKTKKDKVVNLMAEGNYTSAVAYIQNILELDPGNKEALYMLETAKRELESGKKA